MQQLKEDNIILNKQLKPKVYLNNCIIQNIGSSYIKILNTTNEDVQLKNGGFNFEPLNNYILANQNKNIKSEDDKEKI